MRIRIKYTTWFWLGAQRSELNQHGMTSLAMFRYVMDEESLIVLSANAQPVRRIGARTDHPVVKNVVMGGESL